jgi:hypothetical protein
MVIVRERLDVIQLLSTSTSGSFAGAEAAAFHGRKVAEGIAFGCLLATENGLAQIPRDARGQWNAERIVERLTSKGITTFPSPSAIRRASEEECRLHGVTAVVEGLPSNRMSVADFVVTYRRMHRWLHELNPYVSADRQAFLAANSQQLWDDLRAMARLIEQHLISIAGEGFLCTLRDRTDGTTKVLPLSKVAHLQGIDTIGA